MAAKKKRTVVEWVGGLVSTPAYVTGEGAPYRPESLFWMGADGAVLGHATGKPGELLGLAAESLRSTIEQPMFGRPQVPGRIRVGSPELAETLRAVHEGIEVVCAPTPEIDDLVAALRERMSEDADQDQSYLSPETGPDAVGAFFRAAAGLFRAQPWKIVPDDQSLLSVSIEKLGVRDAVLSVIGQMGESLGIVLFSSPDDFEVYLEAADAIESGEEPVIPPHFALNFEPGAELSPALRKEILDHHWEVAATDAHPRLIAVDEDLAARPPTAREVTLAEAIALALTHLLAERKAVLSAWDGGDAVERTLVVATHAGDIEVTLRVPHERHSARFRPPYDVMAALHELGQHGDEIDDDVRRELEDELVERFAASPEAKTLAEVQSCRLIMDLAASYFGATVATLDAAQLRELIFEIVPRKVSVDASAASELIDACRAFYAFIDREFGLEQARVCIRVLGGDAVARLEAALSDPSKFGMAKSLFMGGREAGFDMGSKEGIEAWMHAMQSGPLPPSLPLPSLGAPRQALSRAAARAKKNQRKAARSARKKNRR